MSDLQRQARVPLDLSSFNAPRDNVTNQDLKFWRRSAVRLDLGFFLGNAFLTDLSGLQSVTVQFRKMEGSTPPDPDAVSPDISKVISEFDGSATSSGWANNTEQHASVEISAAAFNLEAGKYWVTFAALLTGVESPQIFGAGGVEIVEGSWEAGVEPPEDPETFITQLDTRYVQIGGPAVVESLVVQSPGLYAMDEAVAELDDSDVLHVPSPGKGNVLLVRRQESPAGGDTIAAFTGLVPGALYWLVHDDGATDPIRFGAHEIRDGGDPLPIRATSATAARVAGHTQTARTAVIDATYTVTAADTLVAMVALTAPRTVTLPDATTYPDHRILTVKDESGDAGTDNITVAADGSQTIDGAASVAIDANYGSVRLYSVGADWFTI